MRLFGLDRHSARKVWPAATPIRNTGTTGTRAWTRRWCSAAEGETGAATLTIEGEPFVTRAQPLQPMTVYANGCRAAFSAPVQARHCALHIPVEPEWWFHRSGWSVFKVVFHLPNSVRPVDVGEGEDGREMGFCFRSLVLEQR